MTAYPEPVKEFWVYTLARIALLLVTWGALTGAWILITGKAAPGLTLVIAFVVTGIGSYYVLRGPREALARKVDARASRAVQRFEEGRSKEDVD
ncbi:hypothetical protein BH11ACT8_BH11ACT8_20530 [soil metagenome]